MKFKVEAFFNGTEPLAAYNEQVFQYCLSPIFKLGGWNFKAPEESLESEASSALHTPTKSRDNQSTTLSVVTPCQAQSFSNQILSLY